MARTVRTTEYHGEDRRPVAAVSRTAGVMVLACLTLAALLAMAGCSGGTGTNATGASTTPTSGAHMAGPTVDVHITQAAANARPQAWDLTTPQSAVRSYLDWTTYAYRTAQSDLATVTMTSYEEVRVNSYIQLNIQKQRILDQTLDSITFGKPSTGSTSTLQPAKENWTYSYLSIDTGNKVLEGPFTASYDTTYTVIKTKSGAWVVDSVAAKAKGTVK